MAEEAEAETETAFKFNTVVKHGTLTFSPGIVYGFQDPDASVYFGNMGWGEETDEEIVYRIPKSMVDIDPETVFADGPNKGKLVMGG